MKTFKKCLTLIMASVLFLYLSILGISAATETQDGLTVTFTTDRETYESAEQMIATLVVTNNNAQPMLSVTMQQLLPDGYQLAEDQKDTKVVSSLQPGETVVLTVILVPTGVADSGFDFMKYFSENRTLVLIIAGALVAVILIVALVSAISHSRRVFFVSLFLCMTMLLSSLSGIFLPICASEPVSGNIHISTDVTIDGNKCTLEAEVDYSMDPEETVEEICTVTFDTLGGSAVEPQQIENGGLAVRPDVPTLEGHVFVGWYADAEYATEFDFAAPITKSCTVYAYWINTEDETDTDGDGLTDELEKFFGTDKEKVDTDGDGLSDYVEIMVLSYDPLKTDTDKNGTTDDLEDLDQDGLDNKTEMELGTDPAVTDTDSDNLSDGMEITKYKTDPLVNDTDGDGVSDGKEIELRTDPLSVQATFEVEAFADTHDSVIPSVKIDLPGEQVESLSIEPVLNETFFPEAMPGYMGQAYDFNVDGEFESAEISFEFDASLLEAGADPVIYYFNEETQELEALETIIEGNVAKTTVQHFSKYILVDRKIYEDQFTWTDVWDNEHNFTDIEIVFVIDDSGSMDWSDPSYERLAVARTLIDNLPVNSKIGLVRFDGDWPKTEALTKTLTTDKEEVKKFLTRDYFYSPGGTDMYNGINKAFPLFESTESTTLKMMIVLSDGATDDTHLHSSVVNTANNSNVRIYTVGLGSSTSYFNHYLKPLANNTGAVFYLASDATQLADIYKDIKEKIDIETDSDADGIPDYYEDNMIYFNGVQIVLDKNNPDSDGDGLLDGEEVELKYEYNEDRTQVKVTGRIVGGNPVNKDTDGDGWIDSEDENPLVWDVSDRDLAMCAALCYEDGQLAKNENRFYKIDEIIGNDLEPGENYYFLGFASSVEMAEHWRVVDYINDVSPIYVDHFSATTFKNGNNIIIAYRGTNETLEWLDNVVAYGILNHHAEERQARKYAERIAKQYPHCNIYITGHSLGGYLAQIGTLQLIESGKANMIKRTAYFNGIGINYNPFVVNLKKLEVLALYNFAHDGLKNNGKLISYAIEGDWVHMLGTHYGEENEFLATDKAIKNHFKENEDGYSVEEWLATVGHSGIAVIASALSSPELAYYYVYYGATNFIDYTWATHETDSFFYHLTAGTRGKDFT